MSRSWKIPRFSYGDRVRVIPNDRISGRVIDLHFIGMSSDVEYDVRYFHEGKDFRVRVFEDELEPDPTSNPPP